MKIIELTEDQFSYYANNHVLTTYYQTTSYAKLMATLGYKYHYIAYVDDLNKIHAASLILYKKINFFTKYGYAPKGFLIDYMDNNLLAEFTKAIRKYYKRKSFSFIKINPEIAIGQVLPNYDYKVKYNQNNIISKYLEQLRYKPIKKDKSFKNNLPVYNAILPLKSFNLDKTSKSTRNKVRNCLKRGLELEKAEFNKIDILYEFIKKQKLRDINFYKDLCNIYNKNNSIDFFLVKTNYNKYIENIKILYENELETNTVLADLVQDNPKEININRKMESDEALAILKDDMKKATDGFYNNEDKYIAGALIIKHKKRVSIFISGYDKGFDYLNPNYYLHFSLAEYYKETYEFLDLNGISGDFNPESKYYGLNKFKLGFNPKIYEFIGEYDLVVSKIKYNLFLSSPKLLKKYQKNNQQ